MNGKNLLAILALVGAGIAPAQGQPSAEIQQHIRNVESGLLPAVVDQDDPHPGSTIADRMAALHVPGVSIAVIHGGTLEWAKGYGVAHDGTPVDTETMFQAGSISKPLAALAALRLVELGKLSLDADINLALKSWKLPTAAIANGKTVTLRELLTHTAGITVHGFPGYAEGEPVPSLVQVLNGEKPANTPAIRIETEPGTKWNYSGGGFTIAQQAMIDVSGQSFPVLLHDTVLAPIGMNHSTYGQPLPAGFQAQAAAPYDFEGKPIKGGAHTYPEMAAAGLWTTPSDLARYAIEVQKSLQGQANHVLSISMVRQMLTPGVGDWGLGVQIEGSKSDPAFTHGGVNAGFRNSFTAYEHGDGVFVMTNGDNGDEIASELIRSVAAEYHWPDHQPNKKQVVHVDPALLSSYAGTYALSPSFNLTIGVENGRLSAQGSGQGAVGLLAISDTRFIPESFEAEIEFFRADSGQPAYLILRQNGNETKAKRI